MTPSSRLLRLYVNHWLNKCQNPSQRNTNPNQRSRLCIFFIDPRRIIINILQKQEKTLFKLANRRRYEDEMEGEWSGDFLLNSTPCHLNRRDHLGNL